MTSETMTDTVRLKGKFVILSRDGVDVEARKIMRETPTTFSVGMVGPKYSKKTFTEIGATIKNRCVARIVERDEFYKIEKALNEERIRKREQEYAEEEARLKAAYDALPDAVKCARAISWYCDRESEDCLADAPIEALKAIAEWIKKKE